MPTIRPDGLDVRTVQHLHRSNSTSSDMMSTANSVASSGTTHTAPAANPPPAYIAQNEASDLISAELERKVTLAPAALTSLNDFLDAVLYSIITTAHSIALGNLKSAVSIVLRPRLGKAALKVAEEELKEYMEEGEEEELSQPRTTAQSSMSFDTDLVWKLTRLRCMVYARMGDLEEEDEEEWLERERLLEQVAAARKAGKTNIEVGPAAAIFLTAVIEYLAEQALYYAAQHSQKRHETIRKRNSAVITDESRLTARSSDIVMDAKDMNQVGRDSPLSRLWRSWRRGTKSLPDIDTLSGPSEDLPSPTTRPTHYRSTSASITPTIGTIEEERRTSKLSSTGATVPPATSGVFSPLELSRGLKNPPRSDALAHSAHRPLSLPVMPLDERYNRVLPTIGPLFQERSPLRPKWDRRSSSLPNSQVTSPTIEHESYFKRPFPLASMTQVHALVTTTPSAQLPTMPLVSAPSDEPSVLDETSFGDVQKNENLPGTDEAVEGVSVSSQHNSSVEQAPARTQGPRLVDPDITGLRHGESLLVSKLQDETSAASTTPPVLSNSGTDGSSPDDLAEPEAQRSVASALLERSGEPNSTQLRQEEEMLQAQDLQTLSPVRSGRSEALTSHTTSGDHEAATPQRSPAAPAAVWSAPEPTSRSSDHARGLPQDSIVSSKPTSYLAMSSRDSTASGSRTGSANGHSPGDSSFNDTTVKANRSPLAAAGSSHKNSYDRIRVSEDEIMPVVSHEQNKRNLELLINSNETLHYTLTPAPVAFRPGDFATPAKRTQTQDLADFFRNTGPPGQDLRPKTARSAKRSVDPPHDSPTASTGRTGLGPRAKLHSRVALSTSSSLPSRKRNPFGEPRDAKVGRDRSIRDLADYMRSTGPSSEDQLPSVIGGVRSASRNTQHNAGGWVAPTPGNPPPRPSSVPRRSTPSPRPVNRLKFQARDARPSRRAESSALIEFIREGPPPGHGEQHAEPNRSTMYTDGPTSLNGASKSSSSTAGVPSVDTTTSSQAPLLRHSHGHGDSSQPSTLQRPVVGTNGVTPTRTRRRVRDPYAIDISDDELEEPAVRRRERDEESLIDFLRNTAPDQETADQVQPSSDPTTRGRSTQARSNGLSHARASSPHLTKAGSKLDSYRPTQLTHASHVDRNRQRKQASLYDDDSAPEPQISRYRPVQSPKEDGGLKKFFSIRGKAR